MKSKIEETSVLTLKLELNEEEVEIFHKEVMHRIIGKTTPKLFVSLVEVTRDYLNEIESNQI